jgi:hypothetical protein
MGLVAILVATTGLKHIAWTRPRQPRKLLYNRRPTCAGQGFHVAFSPAGSFSFALSTTLMAISRLLRATE